MCCNLIEFLPISDIFFKFRALNKNFNSIFLKMKEFTRPWKIKYMQEFISNEDRIRKKYDGTEGEEAFMKLFRDNMFDPEGEQTMFDFFKNSLAQQLAESPQQLAERSSGGQTVSKPKNIITVDINCQVAVRFAL